MNYAETRDRMIRTFPFLYPTEWDVLLDIFFCGRHSDRVEWYNGRVRARWVNARNEYDQKRDRWREYRTAKKHGLNPRKPTIANERKAGLERVKWPGHVVAKLHPEALIRSIPKNIKRSWLLAVKKALHMALTKEWSPEDRAEIERIHAEVGA